MMKFDLISAINIMNKEFNDASTIKIHLNHLEEIEISLSVSVDSNHFTDCIILDRNILDNNLVEVAVSLFKYAIERLHHETGK